VTKRAWRPRDICVVETEPLALLVEAFISDRKNSHGFHPVTWLVERTKDGDPTGRGISPGRIATLLNREREYTDLRIADALLVAMGQVEALYNGTCPIVQNPGKPGCCQLYPARLAWALVCRD
jgi:hypothetical protein